MDLHPQLRTLLQDSGFEIVEEASIAARTGQMLPPPSHLNAELREHLARRFPSGVYSHQAKGIDLALDGADVCLATATASGKSLVFMSAAVHLIKSDPSATVLALYPARALIQDQVNKWKSLLTPLGLKAGYIDGGVNTAERPGILQQHRVVLMTPDVAHAWLLSHLGQREVSAFLGGLRLLVLDEAHVYEGVFGTNMAYFVRRLRAASGLKQIISSTATIGSPEKFLEDLTGRRPVVLAGNDDGAFASAKTVLLTRPVGGSKLEKFVDLILAIARSELGRFIAFADSRKMVEQLVAIAQRRTLPEEDESESEEAVAEGSNSEIPRLKVLPYRAGYEESDRTAIQQSLARGDLAGVVSTSALELGLDIGEIDIVLLLGTPPSVKAFWQRFGRAGRKNEGFCLLLDHRGIIAGSHAGLKGYLSRSPETGWLYLGNQYIAFSQALCAAVEAAAFGPDRYRLSCFEHLPGDFVRWFNNELHPTETIPDELYPLKQRAEAGPHYEFLLRSGIEQTFRVKSRSSGPIDHSLGSLSYSQAMRETYPGAIYYYMAEPFRVRQFKYKVGEIWVTRERRWTSQPIAQVMVFPKFPGGVLQLRKSDEGFIAEAELQVSERVLGFIEQRGPNKIQNDYGTGSPYSQRPITRFFETSGVCWFFPSTRILTEAVAASLLEAFCATRGVQERDLGLGIFHANPSSIWDAKCKGVCIYDSTQGSLRLTERLAAEFKEIVEAAITIARSTVPRDPSSLAMEFNLEVLMQYVEATTSSPLALGGPKHEETSEWIAVVKPGQKAIHVDGSNTEDVTVVGYRYTPMGLLYDLAPPRTGVNWSVKAGSVFPINGVTDVEEYNLMSGETRPVG